ncbi:hypothetical protein QBC43DRAFT_212510 [Cladorrhinum sp. PSN259]|nr:hypothetical protein QBC43DRAFT_212510 [Cladorrhinum sp. PSN259]
MSSIVNKIKEAVHGDKHSQPEGTSGPHNSRVANAADPRVDSDNSRRTAGHGELGSSGLGHSTGTTGTSGFGTHSSGTTEGATGPHNSRVANALDPRVDSDRDNSKTVGNTGYGSSGIGHNTHSTGSSGIGHNTHSTGTSGFGTHTSGTAEGVHGPHSSRLANAADPRVDSDRDHSRTVGNNAGGHLTSGPGPAPNTAGPHSSNIANKLDPTVDSDRDGSNTLGANRTYQSNTHSSSLGHRDPTDAAQVPPSVLKRAIGDPIVEHDDHHHQRERRNSVKSHQERFSGI